MVYLSFVASPRTKVPRQARTDGHAAPRSRWFGGTLLDFLEVRMPGLLVRLRVSGGVVRSSARRRCPPTYWYGRTANTHAESRGYGSVRGTRITHSCCRLAGGSCRTVPTRQIRFKPECLPLRVVGTGNGVLVGLGGNRRVARRPSATRSPAQSQPRSRDRAPSAPNPRRSTAEAAPWACASSNVGTIVRKSGVSTVAVTHVPQRR